MINICLYFSRRDSQTPLDLTPGEERKETAFIEQAVNGEDVWTGHLEPALQNDHIRFKGVVHHYQNHWFTLWRQRRAQGESGMWVSPLLFVAAWGRPSLASASCPAALVLPWQQESSQPEAPQLTNAPIRLLAHICRDLGVNSPSTVKDTSYNLCDKQSLSFVFWQRSSYDLQHVFYFHSYLTTNTAIKKQNKSVWFFLYSVFFLYRRGNTSFHSLEEKAVLIPGMNCCYWRKWSVWWSLQKKALSFFIWIMAEIPAPVAFQTLNNGYLGDGLVWEIILCNLGSEKAA